MKINELMEKSNVKFGTSGARGLVVDMTDEVCYSYTLAFLQHLQEENFEFDRVVIGGDLRSSTPRILKSIAKSIEDCGYKVVFGAYLPSPAIALYGLEQSCPSIMVTGSHIPDDRNGIKFNTPNGEITKLDELGIKSQSVSVEAEIFKDGFLKVECQLPEILKEVETLYCDRYQNVFSNSSLEGLTLGVYQHSAVGRDVIPKILESLGAKVELLARSEKFIPVDTEAIRPEDVELAKKWVSEIELDGIITTDGDSDRPILATDKGEWIRGDVLGVLAAQELQADAVSTPISCNSIVERVAYFKEVRRTKIGSPFVIEEMAHLSQEHGVVVGYEANGGFLTQTSINYQGKELAPLPTRDALLPVLAVILMAKKESISLSQLLSEQLKVATESDRIQEIPTANSKAFLEEYFKGADLKKVKSMFEPIAGADLDTVNDLDGQKMFFKNGEVIHLRPSGNAPEFRCYAEASHSTRAAELVMKSLAEVKRLLG